MGSNSILDSAMSEAIRIHKNFIDLVFSVLVIEDLEQKLEEIKSLCFKLDDMYSSQKEYIHVAKMRTEIDLETGKKDFRSLLRVSEILLEKKSNIFSVITACIVGYFVGRECAYEKGQPTEALIIAEQTKALWQTLLTELITGDEGDSGCKSIKLYYQMQRHRGKEFQQHQLILFSCQLF